MNTLFKKNSLYADLSLLLVAIIWGSGFVASKNALNSMPPHYINAIRFALPFILLCIVFWKKIKTINLKDLKSGGIIGIFLFLGFATQTVGLQYTTASKQAFLTGTNVVIVPFLYWAIKNKKPDRYNLVATFLCLSGIGFLTLQGGFSINLGDGLTLACAVFFACHIVSIGVFAENHDPIILTIIQFGVAAIFSTICALSFEIMPKSFSAQSIFPILYLAVFSTLVAFVIQNVAQKYTTPTHAAIILSLESVFGSILSVILLGDVFTFKMVIGCTIVFAAIITAETKWEFMLPPRGNKAR
jgi:drug/metabolite transporter (DMT)-like permease